MGKFSYQSKLRDIFKDERAAKLIEAFAPGALMLQQLKTAEGLTLAMAMGFKFAIKQSTGRSEQDLQKLLQDIFAIE